MLRHPKILTSSVATLSGLLLLLGLFPQPLLASPVEDDRIRILLIGDSHSATGDKYVSGKEAGQSYRSYADQLELELAESHALTNIACPGASLLDWTRNSKRTPCPPPDDRAFKGLFRTLAQPELPVPIAVVLLGTNDSIGWYEPTPVPPEAFASSLDELLAALEANGAETIVLMTPPDQPVFPEDRVRLVAYRETILNRCTAREHVVCGPDLFTLLDADLDFVAGELHPNGAGHSKIATALEEVIRRLPTPKASAQERTGE